MDVNSASLYPIFIICIADLFIFTIHRYHPMLRIQKVNEFVSCFVLSCNVCFCNVLSVSMWSSLITTIYHNCLCTNCTAIIINLTMLLLHYIMKYHHGVLNQYIHASLDMFAMYLDTLKYDLFIAVTLFTPVTGDAIFHTMNISWVAFHNDLYYLYFVCMTLFVFFVSFVVLNHNKSMYTNVVISLNLLFVNSIVTRHSTHNVLQPCR